MALNLEFWQPTTNVAVSNGLLTYNYTHPTSVAATPEPSSLALLGTGIAGLLRRKRR